MKCDKCGKDFKWPDDGGYGDISIHVFDSEVLVPGWDGLDRTDFFCFCRNCTSEFLWEHGRPLYRICNNCKHYAGEMCFEGEMKRDPYRMPYNTCEHWEMRDKC